MIVRGSKTKKRQHLATLRKRSQQQLDSPENVINAGIDHTMGATAPRGWLVRSALRHAWFVDEGDAYLTPTTTVVSPALKSMGGTRSIERG